MSGALHALAFLLFATPVAVAAASDALTMTIPNRLALALATGFAAMVPIFDLSIASVALHCAAAAIVLAGAFGLFVFGLVGGGDAKLAAAITLWMGWSQALEFVLATTICGGVLALGILTCRHTIFPVIELRRSRLLGLEDSEKGMPLAVALAAAAFLVYPHTVWMNAALA